jgi:hypothetical protein
LGNVGEQLGLGYGEEGEMRDKVILDEKIIARKGPLQRIKRWWKGIHPDRGTVHQGWTGLETVEEKDRIVPERVFTVKNERK